MLTEQTGDKFRISRHLWDPYFGPALVQGAGTDGSVSEITLSLRGKHSSTLSLALY